MVEIKEYEEKYINQISNLIVQNLLEINSKDYGIDTVMEMAKDFTVSKLSKTLKTRKKVVIAVDNAKVLGTAGLDKSWYSDDEYWILAVFVKPEFHGKGIGKQLIHSLENFASTLSIKKIVIPASITAHEFYYKLRYKYKDGKKELNDENMYIMEKLI